MSIGASSGLLTDVGGSSPQYHPYAGGHGLYKMVDPEHGGKPESSICSSRVSAS